GTGAKWSWIGPIDAEEQTTQTRSIPASSASSTTIWRTGLVTPSRSTSGNSSFWIDRVAGKWRGAPPAAAVTPSLHRAPPPAPPTPAAPPGFQRPFGKAGVFDGGGGGPNKGDGPLPPFRESRRN